MAMAISSPLKLAMPTVFASLQFRSNPKNSPRSLVPAFSIFNYPAIQIFPKFRRHSIQCTSKDAPPEIQRNNVGVPLYKPKSYEVLTADAANLLAYALIDGKTRLEISPCLAKSPHIRSWICEGIFR